jgi:hypothetical protein
MHAHRLSLVINFYAIDEIPGYPHARAVRLPTPVLIITTRGIKL